MAATVWGECFSRNTAFHFYYLSKNTIHVINLMSEQASSHIFHFKKMTWCLWLIFIKWQNVQCSHLHLLLQDNNFLQSWLLGKISSNVFTIAGRREQSHNPNTYYQLGPRTYSKVNYNIWKSNCVLFCFRRLEWKQRLEEKRITLEILIPKE